MSGSFGQFAATTQFYLYGRSRCTKTGWEKARKAYPKPDILEDPNLLLTDRVYMITGANAGIGREITQFVASKGATVFMVCRNKDRAEAARREIVDAAHNNRVHILLGDCGLEADIRRMWGEFLDISRTMYKDRRPRLDGLVCNAGALLNHKTFTAEGVEVTFATHLLFGTYLLTNLALETLVATPQSRVIVVSSGGMYNTKFPAWDVATSTGPGNYDGQFAYAYAKRAQVLLCERWAAMHSGVKFLSCHPGWTQTEAVDAAYGESKKYLEPLRNTWQGAEGIIWLTVAPVDRLENGGFYLDRSPQVKHIAGPFFSEGSFTKNSREEVDRMMEHLQAWSHSETRPSLEEAQSEALRVYPLKAMTRAIDLSKFMGVWYVLGHIPTYAEVGTGNGIENYEWDEVNQRVRIKFQYLPKGATALSEMHMRGTINNAPINTHWAIDPKVFGVRIPLGMDYLLLDVAEDDSWCMVGVPDRSYLWIMTRAKPTATDEYNSAMTTYGVSAALLATPRRRDSASSRSAAAAESSETATPTDAVPNASPVPPLLSVAIEGSAHERQVMLAALRKAQELGFDPAKVMRVPWTDLSSSSPAVAGATESK